MVWWNGKVCLPPKEEDSCQANLCVVVCSVGMGVVPVVSVSVSSLQARVLCGACHACVRAFGHSMYLPFLQACPSSEGVSPALGGWSYPRLLLCGDGLSFSRVVGDFLSALLSISGCDPRLTRCVIVSLDGIPGIYI